jgi:hypothetical protein
MIIFWLLFYLIGIPSDYFTKCNLTEKILLSLITFFGVIPFIGFIFMVLMDEDYFKISIWLAFYSSVPLFILDFIVVGIINKNGFNYLITHWYITAAYIYVWIELPLLGFALKKLTNKFKVL